MSQSVLTQKDVAYAKDNAFGIVADSTQEDIVDILYAIAEDAVDVDAVYQGGPAEPYTFEVSFDGIRFQPETLPTCTAVLRWYPEDGSFYALSCSARKTKVLEVPVLPGGVNSKKVDVYLTELVDLVGDFGELKTAEDLQQYLIAVGVAAQFIE